MPPQLQVPRGVSSRCPALSGMVQGPITLSPADLRARTDREWIDVAQLWGWRMWHLGYCSRCIPFSCVSCLSSLRIMCLTWATFHSVLEDCSVYQCLHLLTTCSLHAHYHNVQRHTHALSWSLEHKGGELSVLQWLSNFCVFQNFISPFCKFISKYKLPLVGQIQKWASDYTRTR